MISRKYNRGFTLIETFVAVLILVFAVIGPLGLLSRAIADGNYAKNQVTAYYLAQEALELFINQRDRNLQSPGVDWLNSFNSCSGQCKIWFESSLRVEDCSDVDDCRLYISNNRYTHTIGGESSIFSRYLSLTDNGDGSADLRAVVEWRNKEDVVDFVLTTQVFDTTYDI